MNTNAKKLLSELDRRANYSTIYLEQISIRELKCELL